jgi:hypothetical protein
MSVIKLGDVEFPLKSTPPKGGYLVVLMKRLSSGGPHRQMAALYDMIETMVEDSTGLDDAISQMELEDLEAALADAVRSLSDLPTERPSPSAPGSQPTVTTSKVVSLSRGTVRVESLTG